MLQAPYSSQELAVLLKQCLSSTQELLQGTILQVTKIGLWQAVKKVSAVLYKIRELWCYTGGSELGKSLNTHVKGQESRTGAGARSAGSSLLTLCPLLPCSFQSQTLVSVTGKTHPFNNRNKDDSWMRMDWYFPWNRTDQEKPILELKSFLQCFIETLTLIVLGKTHSL